MAEPEILTIEELIRATETMVELPGLSKELGVRKIRVRRLGRTEYFGLLPPLPTEAEDWPADEFQARERAWLESIGPDELEGRRQALRDLDFRIVAKASLEPALTVDQARRLGDDAAVAALEILVFSRLRKPAAAVEATPDAAAETPGDAP